MTSDSRPTEAYRDCGHHMLVHGITTGLFPTCCTSFAWGAGACTSHYAACEWSASEEEAGSRNDGVQFVACIKPWQSCQECLANRPSIEEACVEMLG